MLILKKEKFVMGIDVNPKFELGDVCLTEGVVHHMCHSIMELRDIQNAIGKYAVCDWGDCSHKEWMDNDLRMKTGRAVMGRYQYWWGMLYIVTEGNRSRTCIGLSCEC